MDSTAIQKTSKTSKIAKIPSCGHSRCKEDCSWIVVLESGKNGLEITGKKSGFKMKFVLKYPD